MTDDTYLGVSVFVHFGVCAAVHAKWACALPLMLFAHQSVAASKVSSWSRIRPSLVLIPAQMIDSPGAESVVSAPGALWPAVNAIRVTLCHQERKGRGKKAMKVTGVGAMGIKRKKSKECRASCQNATYQFWQRKTSELSVSVGENG